MKALPEAKDIGGEGNPQGSECKIVVSFSKYTDSEFKNVKRTMIFNACGLAMDIGEKLSISLSGLIDGMGEGEADDLLFSQHGVTILGSSIVFIPYPQIRYISKES